MNAEVGRHPQYEVFADEFDEHAQDGFYNAHFDRPACLDLLGEVSIGACSTWRAVPGCTPWS